MSVIILNDRVIISFAAFVIGMSVCPSVCPST